MRLGEYPMVLRATGSRDAVRLIRAMTDYLGENFGQEFVPNMYGGKRIELDESNLQRFIRQSTANDGVFYTRLDAANDLSISLSLNQPPKLRLPEVLTVNFLKKTIVNEDAPFDFENLLALFQFGVRLFEPYWGGMYDDEQSGTDEIQKLRLEVDAKMVPYAINWFNYFGSAMVGRLGGEEKLLSAPVYLAERFLETGGVVLVLQQQPFDFTIAEHRRHQRTVHEYLNLDELHSTYTR